MLESSVICSSTSYTAGYHCGDLAFNCFSPAVSINGCQANRHIYVFPYPTISVPLRPKKTLRVCMSSLSGLNLFPGLPCGERLGSVPIMPADSVTLNEAVPSWMCYPFLYISGSHRGFVNTFICFQNLSVCGSIIYCICQPLFSFSLFFYWQLVLRKQDSRNICISFPSTEQP